MRRLVDETMSLCFFCDGLCWLWSDVLIMRPSKACPDSGADEEVHDERSRFLFLFFSFFRFLCV